MEYTNIVTALKDAGHNVDEKNFSSKMSDPKFVEKVRSALELEGHKVPDSSTFYSKYVNKPVSQNIPQTASQTTTTPTSEAMFEIGENPGETLEDRLYRKVQGSDKFLKMVLPRTYSDEFYERSTPSRFANLGKDILSFPGRVIATGAQMAGDIVGGDRSDIAEKGYEGLRTTESSGGLQGLPEDIARSPYTFLPTGSTAGLAKGIGKFAPSVGKMVPALQTMGIVEPVGRYAAEGAAIQGVENLAAGKPLSDNLGEAGIVGGTLGLLPGLSHAPALKNKLAIKLNVEKPLAEKVKQAGDYYPTSEELVAYFDHMASQVPGYKSPKTDIQKLIKFDDLVQQYISLKNTGLNAKNIISPENMDILKKGQLVSKPLDFGLSDLIVALSPFGTTGVVAKKGAELAYKKSPQLEAVIGSNLAQGVGGLFQPASRQYQQKLSEKKSR